MSRLDSPSPLRGIAVGIGIAAASLALALAPTLVVTALAVCLLFGISVVIGLTFSPSVAQVWAGCLVPALGAGLLFGEMPHAGALWVIFGVTLVGTIVALSRISSRLRADAVTDPLTGLHNRFGLIDACERAMANARRIEQELTVVHIDLDRFKQVNDLEGHSEGDRLLKLCADLWRAEIRTGDILARIGGDEFVLVLPGSNRAEAVKLLDRLHALSPIEWCYGIAELGPGDTLQSCVARADTELYTAKAERNLYRMVVAPRSRRTAVSRPGRHGLYRENRYKACQPGTT